MRVIHGKGFTEEDRIGYTTQVYGNLVLAIQDLITAAKKMQLNLEHKDHKVPMYVDPFVIIESLLTEDCSRPSLICSEYVLELL